MKISCFIKLCAQVVAPVLLCLSVAPSSAAPLVGRKAASKYFSQNTPVEDVKSYPTRGGKESESNSGSGNEELLMLGFGSYINSTAYSWGPNAKEEEVGKIFYGLTYFFEEYSRADMNLRIDFTEYKAGGERAYKISLLPLLTFPRKESHFPLYFGLGAGLGIFFVQVPDESSLSFDYQLVAGARFLELAPGLGVFIEIAMRNHLQFPKDGQLNGTGLAAGGAFSF
jgi:hypothetical protein